MSPKTFLKRIMLASKLFRKPSVVYCANHGLLPEVFVLTPAAKLREQMLLPEFPYETQLNQDIFALIMNRFKAGFFVEIGANDGFTLSNTIYLEEKFGWNGLLIEANPQYSESLKKRKSKAIISAVAKEDGYYEFCSAGLYGGLKNWLDKTHEKKIQGNESITVWGTTLRKILEENAAPERINFISIDVEGAEVPIVEQMCSLRNYRFLCGCIEHNARQADYRKIAHLLKESRYRVVWEGKTKHDMFFVDEEVLSDNG